MRFLFVIFVVSLVTKKRYVFLRKRAYLDSYAWVEQENRIWMYYILHIGKDWAKIYWSPIWHSTMRKTCVCARFIFFLRVLLFFLSIVPSSSSNLLYNKFRRKKTRQKERNMYKTNPLCVCFFGKWTNPRRKY